MCITFTSCLWWWLAECWMDFAIAMIRENSQDRASYIQHVLVYRNGNGEKAVCSSNSWSSEPQMHLRQTQVGGFSLLCSCVWFGFVGKVSISSHVCSTMCCRRPIETFPSAICAAFVRRFPPCLLFEDNSLQNRIVIDRRALYMPELLNCIELHPRPRSAVDNR